MVPPVRHPLTRLMAVHTVASVLVQSLVTSIYALQAYLARKYFGASDWQTLLVTCALPALLSISIFWNEVLERVPLRRYLVIFWLVAVLPLGAIGLAQNYWQMLALHVLACAGQAGWTPLNGHVLKRLYPDAVRGRAYSVITAAALVGNMLAAFAIGKWLEADDDAFRKYLPAAAVLQAVGLVMFGWLSHVTREPDHPAGPPAPWRSLLAPIAHMREILRKDVVFARYEIAFMTYGAGYMICDALLPVLMDEKLRLNYDDAANATRVVFSLGMLALMLPMGWLSDRLGPMRTSSLAFAALTLYPLGLMLSENKLHLAGASAIYGMAMAGVQLGWMLGPLVLAKTREQVTQYAAIHATLVGVRGVAFQGLGMLMYYFSGGFWVPMLLAALALGWSAWQMWRLHGRAMRDEPTPAPAPTAAQTAAVGVALTPDPLNR